MASTRKYKNKLDRPDRQASGLGYKKPKKKAASAGQKARAAVVKKRAEQAKTKGKRQYGADHAKARKMMATNKHRREGTGSNYNPLSSTASNTKVSQRKKGKGRKK